LSTSVKPVSATACGKINLFFQVGSLGSSGYHEVASLYQAVDLCETVRASAAPSWRVTVAGDLTEAQLAAVPSDDSNLVVRAAVALAHAAGLAEAAPLHFEIDKRVPVAGGMGGGSADAAAALLAAAEVWQLDLTAEQLVAVAAKLGADVPFALLGGAAVGTGSGETLRSIAAAELNWVLITDDEGLSTPSVYRELDTMRAASGLDPSDLPTPALPEPLLSALAGGDLAAVAAAMSNDLQPAAVRLRPELAKRISLAEVHGALRAIVSGSGPTVVALADDSKAATQLAAKLQSLGLKAIATRSASGPAALAVG
jgi:4-diphosphocytidyl-2-C-methyl-D-erythritol kinase